MCSVVPEILSTIFLGQVDVMARMPETLHEHLLDEMISDVCAWKMYLSYKIISLSTIRSTLVWDLISLLLCLDFLHIQRSSKLNWTHRFFSEDFSVQTTHPYRNINW